ncbi:hypothetical protein D3C81_1905860 [compost metagenome]
MTVTVLNRSAPIGIVICHSLTNHLSEQVYNRKDKHPYYVDKVPVHCRYIYFGSCNYGQSLFRQLTDKNGNPENTEQYMRSVKAY